MTTFNPLTIGPTVLPDGAFNSLAIGPTTAQINQAQPANIPVLNPTIASPSFAPVASTVVPTTPVITQTIPTVNQAPTNTNEELLRVLRELQSQQSTTPTQIQTQDLTSTTPPQDQTQNAEVIQPPQDFQSILGQFGVSSNSLEDVIKNVSKAYGIDGNNEAITKLDTEFIDKTSEINNDPWISEGIRQGKVAQETAKYEQKKNALVDRLRLQQDVVGKAIDTFYKEREFKKELLFKQLDLKQKQIDSEKAKATATTSDITEYNLAKSQGYTGDFIDYQKQQANLRIVPQTNANISTIDAESAAQALIDGRIAPSQLPGFGANSLKAQAIRKAFQLDPNFDASKAERQYNFGKTEKTQLIQSSINTANDTLDLITKQSSVVPRTNLRFVNGLLLATNKGLSDPNTVNFLQTVNALGDELGTVLGQGSATDFKAQLGLLMVDPTLSDKAFKLSIDNLRTLMNNRLNRVSEQAGQKLPIQQQNAGETRMYQGVLYKKVNGGWQKSK